MNRSLVREALRQARAPATSIEELRQRLGPVVVRGSTRRVRTSPAGQRYVQTIVEYGTKGHVYFAGRIRPLR